MGEAPTRTPVDTTGLAVEWEKEVDIRSWIRPKKGETGEEVSQALFAEGVTESVKAACVPHVHALLRVVLLRVAPVERHPQPCVEPLREQLYELYKKCGVVADESTVVRDSWLIKKFVSLVKVKVRVQKVSTATRCLIADVYV